MKVLRLFNALTQSNDVFDPPNPLDVKIYCCGPTVYAAPHLGHVRTYVFLDVLRRTLRYYLGYKMRTVMNITDLDDKIIEKGGVRVARQYEDQFFETMDSMNIVRPDFAPRVTEYLDIASECSRQCAIRNFAYDGRDGESTYFHTEAYLAKWDRWFPQTQKRDDAFREAPSSDHGPKRDSRDFALWKHAKKWTDAEGKERSGVPGWHTACAAMAHFYFPDSVDIHLGGIDLQFPHHENALTIDRACHERREPWVRFCLYTGHLEVDGQKMSKSLKNFTTVDEMLKEGHSPLAIRYMFMKHAYDTPMRFQKRDLELHQKSYDRFMHNVRKMKTLLLDSKDARSEKHSVANFKEYASKAGVKHLDDVRESIDGYLMNNMNVPKALEELEKYVESFSRGDSDFHSEWLCYCYTYVIWMTGTCFGLLADDLEEEDENEDRCHDLYGILKDFRSQVRDWVLKRIDEPPEFLLQLCDAVRKNTNDMGYVMEDDAECH